MLMALRPGNAIMVNIEYLNFGKLVSGNAPAPDALGVTRRSRGLDPARDGELRLSTLLDVQIFSQSMVDPRMVESGLLLVRTLPENRTVFVRAGFRRTAGVGADPRIHQQSAIWVGRTKDWREHPASFLAKVATLEAAPDSADEPGSERFGKEAAPVALLDTDAIPDYRNDPSLRILDMLLDRQFESRAKDRKITFSGATFATEQDFLTAVGSALQQLPPFFERWDRICIGSGLRQDRPGLFIQYLPSDEKAEAQTNATPVDAISVKSRLENLWGNVRGQSEPMASRQALAAVAAEAPVKPSGPVNGSAGRKSESATGKTPAEAAQAFPSALNDYRRNPTSSAAEHLADLAQKTNGDQFGRDWSIQEREAWRAVNSALHVQSPKQPLGTLFDAALFHCRTPEARYGFSQKAWFGALQAAITERGVLLPQEVARLHRTDVFSHINMAKITQTMNNSHSLAQVLQAAESGSASLPDDLNFLRPLQQRLAGVLSWKLRQGCGIHSELLVYADVILSEQELADLPRTLLYPFLSQYGTAVRKLSIKHSVQEHKLDLDGDILY